MYIRWLYGSSGIGGERSPEVLRRQVELELMIGEPAKAVLEVEASRLLMQRIDYDEFEADVVRGPFEPGEGVEEEQSADPRALVVAVDSEAGMYARRCGDLAGRPALSASRRGRAHRCRTDCA